MFFRRAWSRLRKPSNAGAPYATPAAVGNAPAGAQSSSTSGGSSNVDGKTAGGTSARATSLMAGMAAVSSAAEERIQWRRAGRDRRRTWGFRKLKTRSDSAVSSPEVAAATLQQTPTNLAADVAAGVAAEGAPQSPSASKTAGQSPQAGLAVARKPDPSAAGPVAPGTDDYACLADDDINWSTGYVKLCYMPDALNQGCNSFQDLRKGPDDFPATTVQSQVVVERVHSVEQRVNLRDGRSVFGETTERICYGRKTSQVTVFDGNGTSEQAACELMTFDTNGTTTAVRPEIRRRSPAEPFQHPLSWTADVPTRRDRQRDVCYGRTRAAEGPDDFYGNSSSNSVLNTAGATSTTAAQAGVVPRRNVRRTRSSTAAPSSTPSGTALPRTSRVPTHLLGSSNTGAGTAGALKTTPPGVTSVPEASGTTTAIASTLRENVPVPGSVPKTTAASWQRGRSSSRRKAGSAAKASFDDGDVADIFMFSEDDDDDLCVEEDLCASGGNAVAAPMRPGSGNNHNFEVNLGSRETGGAATGHRVVEDGSGDNRARIELAVRI
ncbi:hypothetical protein MTO96_026984 [Rhipicephalus appendiculatus]